MLGNPARGMWGSATLAGGKVVSPASCRVAARHGSGIWAGYQLPRARTYMGTATGTVRCAISLCWSRLQAAGSGRGAQSWRHPERSAGRAVPATSRWPLSRCTWSQGLISGQKKVQGTGLGRGGEGRSRGEGFGSLSVPRSTSQSRARQRRDLPRQRTICSWSLLLPFPEPSLSPVPPPGDDSSTVFAAWQARVRPSRHVWVWEPPCLPAVAPLQEQPVLHRSPLSHRAPGPGCPACLSAHKAPVSPPQRVLCGCPCRDGGLAAPGAEVVSPGEAGKGSFPLQLPRAMLAGVLASILCSVHTGGFTQRPEA